MKHGKGIIPAVIGGGSWGTALVKLFSHNQREVNWWIRSCQNRHYIAEHRRNPDYLSYLELNLQRISVSCDLNEVLSKSDMIVIAVPAAFIRETFSKVPAADLRNKIVISAVKGIIPGDNLTVSNWLKKEYGIPEDQLGIIAGPCHSEEVAMEKLSFLTLAFHDIEKAEYLKRMLECHFMRISISPDVKGIEYASVLKNIYAIAAGICVGLGYGDNFMSVLAAHSVRELRSFLDHINTLKRDVNNSAYLGDLLVTSYSKFSRNRTLGSMIGKGYSPRSSMMEIKMVAEGYYAAQAIHFISAGMEIELPVVETVYNILYLNHPAMDAMASLSNKIQ